MLRWGLIAFVLIIMASLAVWLSRAYWSNWFEETSSEPEIVEPEAPSTEPSVVDPSLPPPDVSYIDESGAFLTDLVNGTFDPILWYVADYHTEGSQWRNGYSPLVVKARSDGAHFVMENRPGLGHWDLVSGKVQTRRKFGYGQYEVVMRPAKGSGLVSAFFTYTGPFFNDPHDEIDIEFLGKNPGEVEFNTFVGGRAYHHKRHKLGFDATEDFHHYRFDWSPDKIVWYVDGIAVHETEGSSNFIPQNQQRIIANLWTGTIYQWHGRPKFEDGISAAYKCMSYRPAGDTTSPTCASYPTLN